MLLLTRRIGESVIIGEDIYVTVLSIKGSQVRLGVNAPKEIPVHREEIKKRIDEQSKQFKNTVDSTFKEMLGGVR